MDYIPIPDLSARQAIDAAAIFEEWRRATARAQPYAGGMYWKRDGQYEYLVKTKPDNRQERLGRRSQATEAIYQAFHRRKKELEARERDLLAALGDARRLNKAARAGRVPQPVVDILNTMAGADLTPHFITVGTHALYAYETAAGVRIAAGALATQDIDLLWDARKRVQFITDLKRGEGSILKVLQRADATFQRLDDHVESAMNSKGLRVDFLRRQPQGDDPHPFRFSADEDDLWPVQALRASVLNEAPLFEQMVISSNGHMALMRTIDPKTFVEFKKWMAAQAPGREPIKRQRDQRQAEIVQRMLDEGILTSTQKR